MKTIYKYPLATNGFQIHVVMPTGGKLLDVQVQTNASGHSVPCLWAMVETNNPPTVRKFDWAVTGGNSDHFHDATYVGTVQLEGGALVLHLFELP